MGQRSVWMYSNAESTPNCCNCTLAEGKKPDAASYRGCSHAEEEDLLYVFLPEYTNC
jgi:hypothetical protein